MLCIEVCVFFFFKQKTAYEMRISDWSSDVCSSDLGGGELRRFGREIGVLDARLGFRQIGDGRRQIVDRRLEPVLLRTQVGALRRDRLDRVVEDAERRRGIGRGPQADIRNRRAGEERRGGEGRAVSVFASAARGGLVGGGGGAVEGK